MSNPAVFIPEFIWFVWDIPDRQKEDKQGGASEATNKSSLQPTTATVLPFPHALLGSMYHGLSSSGSPGFHGFGGGPGGGGGGAAAFLELLFPIVSR